MVTRIKQSALAFTAFAMYLAVSSFAPSLAQGDANQNSPRPGLTLFNSLSHQEVLEITLKTELDSLIHVRNTEEYTSAEFIYKDESGAITAYEIKVRPRGKFRRKECDFPPLKLKFPKKQLEAQGLDSFNDLKLVTHCLNDEAVSKSLVMREYLAYKLYNELTPNSFRVQLVKVNYQDTNNKKWKMTRWGYLIEEVEELAQRIGAVEVERYGQPVDSFNIPQEKIQAMFQFMIGNADWDYQMLRNVKLLDKGDGKLIPVPYDFDFAMLVKAPYARPNSDVQQTKAMERLFMGFADSAGDLYSTSSYFKTKKDALLAVVQNFKLLDKQDEFEVVQYLEEFFRLVESKEKLNGIRFARLPQR